MPTSGGTKAHRVLTFLLGLRSAGVVAALGRHGFTQADGEEGWRLLQAIGRAGADPSPMVEPSAKLVEQLDAWENRWLPIAKRSLARKYPETAARLFLNLGQLEGPLLTVTLNLFVERIAELAQPAGPYGADGPKARALLERRGLTEEVVDEARALLASLATVTVASSSYEEAKAELARDEAALWEWYLEWSQVARTAIDNRGMLRRLGYLRGLRNEVVEGD